MRALGVTQRTSLFLMTLLILLFVLLKRFSNSLTRNFNLEDPPALSMTRDQIYREHEREKRARVCKNVKQTDRQRDRQRQTETKTEKRRAIDRLRAGMLISLSLIYPIHSPIYI